MSSNMFPRPDGMASFWQSTPSDLAEFRSSDVLPAESEIVIIGGGYSAAALVTHIQARYPNPPSILVLEARNLCSGATGRNGGHIKPDPYWHPASIASDYGTTAGAELAEFELANLSAVKEYVEKEGVDCDMVITRACDVHFTKPRYERAKASLHKMQELGVSPAQEASEVDDRYAEKVSGVKGAKGCITFTAGHLWPYKLIHHMFRRAIERGVNLQTNTPVKEISSTTDAQGCWILTTDRGTIKASKVVLATNAYTSALLPEYKDKIIPYRGVSCHIVTTAPAPLLVNTYALRWKDWDFDYLIPRPDGTIIVGGARSAYFTQKDLWYGNTDDSEQVEQVKRYFDGYMQRHFCGWETSGAYVEDIWTGIMGYSCDKLPRLGPVPGKDGLFIMAGWTGHGMPQIFLSAKGMADMLIANIPYHQTRLPRVFEESAERLAAAPNKVLNSWYQATRPCRL